MDYSNPDSFAQTADSGTVSLGQTTSTTMMSDQMLVGSELNNLGTTEPDDNPDWQDQGTPYAPLNVVWTSNSAHSRTATAPCTQRQRYLNMKDPIHGARVESIDSRCGPNNEVEYLQESVSRNPSTDPSHACGSYVRSTTWKGMDTCLQRSTVMMTQTITITNVKPTFSSTPPVRHVKTSENIEDFAILDEPTVAASCDNVFSVWYVDDAPTTSVDGSGCPSWTILRRWYVRNTYNDCSGSGSCPCDNTPNTVVQTFNVVDETPPVFTVTTLPIVSIPFLDNYQLTPSVPRYHTFVLPSLSFK